MPAPTIVWISYMSAVCGCIASVALKGVFKVSVNSASSTTSRVGILTVTPAADYLGAAHFDAGQLLAVVLCFGLGGFFAGIMLTCRAVDGAVTLIKMDYPTVTSWRWRHQLLITVGICSLAVSSAIVQVFDVCLCGVWCFPPQTPSCRLRLRACQRMYQVPKP